MEKHYSEKHIQNILERHPDATIGDLDKFLYSFTEPQATDFEQVKKSFAGVDTYYQETKKIYEEKLNYFILHQQTTREDKRNELQKDLDNLKNKLDTLLKIHNQLGNLLSTIQSMQK